MKKNFLISAVIVIILVIAGFCYFNKPAILGIADTANNTDNSVQLTIMINQTDNSVISYQSRFTLGTNLETIMQNLAHTSNSEFKFEVQSASYGDYVTSINGIKTDSTKDFWELLVNGQESMVGISAYIPKNNDVISFTLATF